MTKAKAASDCGRMLAWHLASTLALLLLPTLLLGWRLSGAEVLAFGSLILGYLASGLLPVVACRRGKVPSTLPVLGWIIGVFGVVFLGLLVTKWPYSRVLLSAVFGAALVVIPVTTARPRGILTVIPLAGVLLGAGLIAIRRELRPLTPSVRSAFVQTALHSVQVEFRMMAIPLPRILGGDLARLGNEYLLMTGDGLFYLFGWLDGTDSLWVRPLPYRVPANLAEFESALWPADSTHAAATSSVLPFWFRGALSLLTDVRGDSVRVYASYLFWVGERKCYVERVAVLDAPLARFMKGEADPSWRTVYETTPCLPLHGSDRPEEGPNAVANPILGFGAGGRMILAGPDSLLLSVGDFEFDGVTIPGAAIAQDKAASYGKTILIHLGGLPAEVFSVGHRNPQGLHRDADGTIWLTEHGPQGGDELNVIRPGANYGWPLVTYGTDYGSTEWPLSQKQGSHEGYETPVYAWIPAIAVSDLIRIEQRAFPAWQGDLLVASLANRALHRVRTLGRRIVFTERIGVDRSIRSLVEGADGRIVLWTNEFLIGWITPNRGATREALFGLRCGVCHSAGSEPSGDYAPPSLAGVVGRPVASTPGGRGFDFSPSLKALGGRWTVERLHAFITNPRSLVPGTIMAYPGLADSAERAAIIEYLRQR